MLRPAIHGMNSRRLRVPLSVEHILLCGVEPSVHTRCRVVSERRLEDACIVGHGEPMKHGSGLAHRTTIVGAFFKNKFDVILAALLVLVILLA